MLTTRSRRRILQAFLVAGILISSASCSALGLMSSLAGGGGRSGLTPSPVSLVPPIDAAPDSVYRVVAWGMAIVLGSLVLAFVAKLLNHRRTDKISSGSRPGTYDGPPAHGPTPT